MTEIDINTDMVDVVFDEMRPTLAFRADVREWVDANIVGRWEVRTDFKRGYFVSFGDDGEASAFRIKWG